MLSVSVQIPATLSHCWEVFTQPEFVKQWNFANDEWPCPDAANNLTEGGEFHYQMAAKDGSFGFDFCGKFDKIEPYKSLFNTLEDGRKMEVHYTEKDGITTVSENFEPEQQNSIDLQQQGWQMILDNYKKVASKPTC